jgi:hypothetical protein
MRWAILATFALAAAFVVAQEQSTAPPQSPSPDQQQSDDTPKKKSLGKRIKDQVTDPWCVHVGGGGCHEVGSKSKDSKSADSDGSDSPDQQVAQQKQPGPGKNAPTPRSDAPSHDGEFSTSRDTMIDLSPPKNDAKLHPNSSTEPDDEIQEVHKWDPHRAAKDVEVGDWYYHQKNYPAAMSRYEEALEFKPNDAIATFHLAETEEKLQQLDDAREHYAAYLKILPEGPYSGPARKALERLGAPPAEPPTNSAPVTQPTPQSQPPE